jgi:hypothetical protein
MNCLYGANICACATIGANFGINLVDITFGNRFNGTLIDTGSASSAFITNFVSHDSLFYVPQTRQVNIVLLFANIGIFIISKM